MIFVCFRTGLSWLLRYNFGSVAFGSFLLALIWFIILVFQYIQKKFEKANEMSGTSNRIAKCLFASCNCCLQCCHRFIKFLNKNAYVQVALNGNNFCTSAINGFLLNLKNRGSFIMTEGLGGVFMYLGKFFIAIGNCLAAELILLYYPDMKDKINSPIGPLALIFTASYIIASVFMSIFSITSISILQCFLTDVELSRDEQGGMDGKHRPAALQELVKLIR